jgi:CheY-like chemotaxis protein
LLKKAIMFVDDSATMRTIAEKTFFAEPFDVVTVPSGEAAVAKLREIRPSLALVDVGMAGVNGYDVCKAIREDGEYGRIPVIIMSGVSTPYDENRGKDVGATEHIKKPFDTAKLIERVVELTKGGAEVVGDGEAIPLQPKPPAQPPKPAPIPAAIPSFQPPQAAPRIPVPPVAPVSPKAPVRPVPPLAASTGRPSFAEAPIKETMEFGRPSHVARLTDAGPAAKSDASEFQVGTLAELAQIDAAGRKARPDRPGDAIDLEPAKRDSLTAPMASEPRAATAVRAQADAAASAVAAQIGGGLTADQVAAIQRLTAEVIERVVWEVVPDLAETLIREKIEALLEK